MGLGEDGTHGGHGARAAAGGQGDSSVGHGAVPPAGSVGESSKGGADVDEQLPPKVYPTQHLGALSAGRPR